MSVFPVHSAATVGFSTANADRYDRARPEYPIECVKLLLEKVNFPPSKSADAVVLELGAGTGKFTRTLERTLNGTAATIITSEPVEGMRQKLISSISGDTKVLPCSAENISLGDETVDLVVAAQSFHWFANNTALNEMHRVLKPDGHLAFIWNSMDQEVKWIAELETILDAYYTQDVPRQLAMKWKGVIDAFNGFEVLQSVVLRNINPTGPLQMIVDRILSVSVVARQSDKEKEKVAKRVTEVLENHPDTRGLATYTLPYRTDIYWYNKT
ncbi:uncharacterized protein LOC134186323 [Corticium candelabrum]|uniref:uncharacterized protein LOC134186323 n=1 Tax=Corticium candelabrum TaxID=121492 RepID=UPI002E265580|nr:uncharacterized protein LOC134186323 [Corticium candelabrum]